MIIVFMHSGAHTAYHFASFIFWRKIGLHNNIFAVTKLFNTGHFNRVFFEKMCKTRIVNHATTPSINTMMAIAEMFYNKMSP